MVHLGKYTDGELLTAVTRVTTDPVGACEWSENVLKTVKHVDGPKFKNNVKLPSEKETFQRILKDIKTHLTAYESGSKNINVNCTLGDIMDFSQVSFEQTLAIRNNLLAFVDNAELASLLAKKQLGSLYYYYNKNMAGWNQSWGEFCMKYLGSRRTAERYIDLYNLLYYYPRLAVCKLSMEAILRFKEMLLQEIAIDYNLAARLSEPLFATQIQLNVNITEEQATATGHVELLTEKSKLQGGWNMEDAIVDGL